MNIGVIGCGTYSLAISLMLNKNKNKVTVWSETDTKIKTINYKHRLDECLPNVLIPESINFTTSLEEAVKDKDIVFIIVAASYVEDVTSNIKKYIKGNTIICIGSKGIEQETCKFIHKIVLNCLKVKHLAVISGPGFAIDVAHNDPIGLSLASSSKYAINMIKKALETDNLKLRETDDILGVEICGAIKNVIAIAAGIISGLGYSESTQAFLITESLHVIKSLIKNLGGNPKTILSYAGIGDIILTCTSTKSRNFKFGKLLGKHSSKKEIDAYLLDNTVEGYYSLKSIYKLVTSKNIDIEFLNIVYDIVFNNESPEILIEFLMSKK